MNKSDSLREQIASLCHEQWSGWMKYLFKQGFTRCLAAYPQDFVIPSSLVDRWTRQMETSYDELSEEEKESDRKEADRFIELWDGERAKIPIWEVEIVANGAFYGSAFRELEAEFFNVCNDGQITFWNYGEQRREQVAMYAPGQWYGVRRKEI